MEAKMEELKDMGLLLVANLIRIGTYFTQIK
jgi:hypothetical protein